MVLRLSSRIRLHVQQGFQEKWDIMNKSENLDDKFLEKEKLSKILKESEELELESGIHIFPRGKRQARSVSRGSCQVCQGEMSWSCTDSERGNREKEAGTVFMLKLDRGSSRKDNGRPVSVWTWKSSK